MRHSYCLHVGKPRGAVAANFIRSEVSIAAAINSIQVPGTTAAYHNRQE